MWDDREENVESTVATIDTDSTLLRKWDSAMAIDLDVIPSVSAPFRWVQLKGMILGATLDHDSTQLVGGFANLREVRSKRLLDESDLWECPGYYHFEFSKDTTLSMAVTELSESESQWDFIDDFGRNLSLETKHVVLRQLQKSGFTINVESWGGRPKGEWQLFTHIANCIAKLTRGWVVIQDNGVFHLPVGIYSSAEFDPSASR